MHWWVFSRGHQRHTSAGEASVLQMTALIAEALDLIAPVV